MKKLKKIGVGILGFMNWLWNDWAIRYKSQLNDFFGKGNWEAVSDELKSSRVHTTRKSIVF